MPIGTFLDTLPTGLFVGAHLLFLAIGIWAALKAAKNRLPYASAFWLYVVVHLGFLGYLFGFLTIRMSVLLEQMLILAMVLWIVTKAQPRES